jgi:hypothetical protein
MKPQHARVCEMPPDRKPKTSIALKMEPYEREDRHIAERKQVPELTKKSVKQTDCVPARAGWANEKPEPKTEHNAKRIELAQSERKGPLDAFGQHNGVIDERRSRKQLRKEAGAAANAMATAAVARRGSNEKPAASEACDTEPGWDSEGCGNGHHRRDTGFYDYYDDLGYF